MITIKVRLLGTPKTLYNDQSVNFPFRKAEAYRTVSQ